MRHSVEVPDSLWAWFQQRSGKTMPGNEIRDALYEYRLNHCLQDEYDARSGGLSAAVYTGPMDNTITAVQEIPKPIPYRLRALDMLPDPFDHQFTKAFEAFLIAYGGDVEAALTYLENKKRGLNNPKAWLIDWYKDPARTMGAPTKVMSQDDSHQEVSNRLPESSYGATQMEHTER